MDRFLNENNIVKRNNNIQNILQKANILKQQTQQKISQLTPEQLASIQMNEPIQINEPIQMNEAIQMNEPIQVDKYNNDIINNDKLINNDKDIYNFLSNTIQISAQSDSVQDDSVKNDSVKNDSIKNDSIKNDSIKNDSVQSDFVQNDSIKDDFVKNDSVQSNFVQNKEEKRVFDAVKQLKTNNLSDKKLTSSEKINFEQKKNENNNVNKSIKDMKKEILKNEKIYTPQEMLIKKQIQAYNDLVGLQVELEITNQMSIRVEEKLRQSYNTKIYNLQIRIREQEIRLSIIADLLSGK